MPPEPGDGRASDPYRRAGECFRPPARTRGRWLALVAAGGFVLAGLLWWCSPLLFRAADRLTSSAVYRIPAADSAVALTIDDAPSSGTGEILRVLQDHGARATFFVIGSRSVRRPDVVAELARRGHGIGHHMWRDRGSVGLDSATFERSLARTGSVLARFGAGAWLRFGGGLFSPRMARAARRHGYRIVLGDVYPFDTVVRWPEVAALKILAWARPGSILILHDGPARAGRTAEVLRRVLPELRSRGLEVVTLDELARR